MKITRSQLQRLIVSEVSKLREDVGHLAFNDDAGYAKRRKEDDFSDFGERSEEIDDLVEAIEAAMTVSGDSFDDVIEQARKYVK